MNNLKKIVKENVNLKDLATYEDITKIIDDNWNIDIREELKDNNIEITIDNNKYYIINITCDYCGNDYYYISVDDDINYIKDYENFAENSDYNIICESCCDNDFMRCEICGELLEDDDIIFCEDNQTYYCESCANDELYQCDFCYEWHMPRHIEEMGNGSIVCNDCYEYNDIGRCEDCGDLYAYDDLNYNENDGCYYCDNCYNDHPDFDFDYYSTEHREDKEVIKHLEEYEDNCAVASYHTNPIEFKLRAMENEENANLFFGVELEVSTEHSENIERTSSFVADNLYCRLEEDSSIPAYGFEIISDPMTLAKWQDRKTKIDQVFSELVKYNFVSHNARGGNCGLHIHASRTGLGNTEAEKEQTINNIILITENFKKELMLFSRRKAFNWCHFFNDDTEENPELDIEKIKANKGYKGRYQVINISNYNTIEFRLCRGTLKTNTFFASIQLFYNIIQLAKNNNFINVTWQDLINLNNFEELQKYNEERQIKSDTKIKIINKKPEPEKKVFETVIILKDNEKVENAIKNILDILNSKDIINTDKQGVKEFAYEIQGETHGYYLIITHYSNFEKIHDFEFYLNSKDNVLKFLSLKKEV